MFATEIFETPLTTVKMLAKGAPDLFSLILLNQIVSLYYGSQLCPRNSFKYLSTKFIQPPGKVKYSNKIKGKHFSTKHSKKLFNLLKTSADILLRMTAISFSGQSVLITVITAHCLLVLCFISPPNADFLLKPPVLDTSQIKAE